jgi:hypothetical protein
LSPTVLFRRKKTHIYFHWFANGNVEFCIAVLKMDEVSNNNNKWSPGGLSCGGKLGHMGPSQLQSQQQQQQHQNSLLGPFSSLLGSGPAAAAAFVLEQHHQHHHKQVPQAPHLF